jgi:hypothetical protein
MIILLFHRIMDEIISYKMCPVKERNAKLRNYLKVRAGAGKVHVNLLLARMLCVHNHV